MTIQDMTMEDLNHIVEERLKQLLISDPVFRQELKHIIFEVDDDSWIDDDDDPTDTRTLEEVYKSIDENMWTPPPGAKSSLELLREDRDS